MPESQPAPEKKKRKFFTLKNKRHMPLWLAGLLACLMKVFSWTYRVRLEDPNGLATDLPKVWPVVFAIWHNRILFFGPLIPRRLLQRSAVLISASRDGEYVSTFIKFFGLNVVRGSSSRGGLHALLELNESLHQNVAPVLTLDGPRGPKYTIHPGAPALAQINQVPILPASVNASHYREIKSWDRTQIPMPFSKVTVVLGNPVSIPQEASREEAAAIVKAAMDTVTIDLQPQSNNRA